MGSNGGWYGTSYKDFLFIAVEKEVYIVFLPTSAKLKLVSFDVVLCNFKCTFLIRRSSKNTSVCVFRTRFANAVKNFETFKAGNFLTVALNERYLGWHFLFLIINPPALPVIKNPTFLLIFGFGFFQPNILVQSVQRFSCVFHIMSLFQL